jgi:hypothetical protein
VTEGDGGEIEEPGAFRRFTYRTNYTRDRPQAQGHGVMHGLLELLLLLPSTVHVEDEKARMVSLAL